MPASLNLTELTTVLGAYCRENKADLFGQMLLEHDYTSRFTVLDDCTDQVPLPRLSMGDFLKPADPTAFAPTTDALVLGARILQVYAVKGDLRIHPQLLEKTWLGQYRKKGSDAYDLPFEQFIMNYISKKAAELLQLKGVYTGVYNGAGTTTVDTMNGLLKIIADEVTATTISTGNNNLVATGAITSANVIDKLELVYDKLGDAFKGIATQMLISPTIYDWYQRLYRSTYGQNQNYKDMSKPMQSFMLDGTNCEVFSEPALAASQRVICTTKENLYYGVDSISDINQITVEKDHRALDIMLDFKCGVQIAQLGGGAFVVNNQV